LVPAIDMLGAVVGHMIVNLAAGWLPYS